MIPKAAIDKAIEGGWKPRGDATVQIDDQFIDGWSFIEPFDAERLPWILLNYEIALDRTFWECLGKVELWDDGDIIREGFATIPYYWMWQYIAHQFYDIILTGGDTDKFWADILSTK